MNQLKELRKLADSVRRVHKNLKSDDGCLINKIVSPVEWAVKEIGQLEYKVKQLTDSRDMNAHVIIENDVVPGSNGSCRCRSCRLVAKAMDEAGHLDGLRDRWWENESLLDNSRTE